MQPGDLICVFLDGSVPWVIRQDGEDYVLIGECYVHGIMNGEIIHTEGIPVQNILLN
jgi:hypothetical protein